MAIPLIIGAGVAVAGMVGAGGYVTGAATSEALGTGLSLTSITLGLFLIFYLAYRFNLFKRV